MMNKAIKKGKAVHVVSNPVRLQGGKWECETERRDIRVMAVAEGYAMVRRPGCRPYIAPIEQLEQ